MLTPELVDLERRQPVTLWLDREAETLAQWLRAHPGVEVITRERASAYADGAGHGAAPLLSALDQRLQRRRVVLQVLPHDRREFWQDFQRLTQRVQLMTALLVGHCCRPRNSSAA